MVDMPKHDLCFLKLHEFKIWHNASETFDRTVWRWFLKFSNGNESLESEEGRGWACSFDNEQLKAAVEQNCRQSVSEISQKLFVNTATISCHLQSIEKVKLYKWVSKTEEILSLLKLEQGVDYYNGQVQKYC